MPVLEPFLDSTQVGQVHVRLEPAQNGLNSLLLLNKAEHLSGYDEWVTRTAAALTPEQLFRNRVVIEGLYYALLPARSWPSFPAYLDFIEAMDPYEMRKRLFWNYDRLECEPGRRAEEPADIDTVLSSFNNYLNYLFMRFSAENISPRIEREAYTLLLEPERMKEVIVSHLRAMWGQWLADEWRRKLPLLRASLEAFTTDAFLRASPAEAARVVMGDTVPEKWERYLANPEIEQFVFVPSPHLGPYTGIFHWERTVWFLFGARLPADATLRAPDLSRSELLVRLNALADDTRLRILRLISDQGELCSQEILQQLDLSQSATSRHLTQLTATGYLAERRRDGSKCYRIEPSRIEDTLQAVTRFLLR